MFNDALEDSGGVSKWLEANVRLYNKTIAARLHLQAKAGLPTNGKPQDNKSTLNHHRSDFRLDLDEIRQAIQPSVSDAVVQLVVFARAEALVTLGENAAALDLMSRYVGQSTEA